MQTDEIFRPKGRSVWKAKELEQSDEWVLRLNPAMLAEINSNLARLTKSNAELESITAKNFPLPSMTDSIAKVKEEIAFGRGFHVIRGLPASQYTLDQLKIIYWGIGAHFGSAMPQSYLGDLVGDIRDIDDEESDVFFRRGYRSNRPQTTHTDCTDIVSMLSIRAAKSGGESTLVSAHTVHNLVLDACPELLKIMYRGFFMRGVDPDALGEGVAPLTPYRIPTYMYTDGWLNCFYTRGYIDRAVLGGSVALNPLEQAAIEVFTAFSNHPEIRMKMLLQPGDMQFVNNRTIMHGRALFDDYPELERRRHLLRLWLTVAEWPRMAKMQDMQGDETKEKWRAYAARQKTPVGLTA